MPYYTYAELQSFDRQKEHHWTHVGPDFAPQTGPVPLRWNITLPPHPISTVNSTSFLPGPNPNLLQILETWPKKFRSQQHFPPPNFVEEETNSLRFNLESICWQMHRARPVGSHLENTDGKGATYQVWLAQGRPAWRPHKLGDQKSPHRMVWT